MCLERHCFMIEVVLFGVAPACGEDLHPERSELNTLQITNVEFVLIAEIVQDAHVFEEIENDAATRQYTRVADAETDVEPWRSTGVQPCLCASSMSVVMRMRGATPHDPAFPHVHLRHFEHSGPLSWCLCAFHSRFPAVRLAQVRCLA
jgi:hypothetical protein